MFGIGSWLKRREGVLPPLSNQWVPHRAGLVAAGGWRTLLIFGTERVPTAAGGHRVGIVDGKAAAHQGVDVIHLNAFQQRGTLRVDNDFDGPELVVIVVGMRFI